MEENNSIYEVNEYEETSMYDEEIETETFDNEETENNEISIYEAEPEEMMETKNNAGIGIAIGAVVIGAAAVAGKVVYDKIKESKDPEIKAKKDELKELKKAKKAERREKLKEKFKFGKKEAQTEDVVDVEYEEVEEES